MSHYWPFCLLGILALSGCATGFRAGAPKDAIDVIAHRGASAYAPENTLASFEKAAELGADWFELDCTLTQDGHVIVIHDDSVDRTTTGQGKAMDQTLEALKALDAGTWYAPEFAGQRLPTIEEALDLAKDRIGVYIEIKNSGNDGPVIERMVQDAKAAGTMDRALRDRWMTAVEESGTPNLALTRSVIAAIRARNMKRQVVIQSFSPVVCFIALAEAPEIRTEYLGGYDKEKPESWTSFLALGRCMRVAGFNLRHNDLTPDMLADFHRNGETVAVWTVDKPEDMARYAEMGVDSIITNKPDVCLDALRQNGKR